MALRQNPAPAAPPLPQILTTRTIVDACMDSLAGMQALPLEVLYVLVRGYNSNSLGSHRSLKVRRCPRVRNWQRWGCNSYAP